jgi:hypothetical protein
MLCETEYKKQPTGMFSDAILRNHGDCFRVRKIVGRADRIFRWLKKQNDVAVVRIIVRAPDQS